VMIFSKILVTKMSTNGSGGSSEDKMLYPLFGKC